MPISSQSRRGDKSGGFPVRGDPAAHRAAHASRSTIGSDITSVSNDDPFGGNDGAACTAMAHDL